MDTLIFSRLRTAIYLALRNAAYEWRVVLTFVIALAAVQGPLLVLFGLKFGVIDAMTAALIEDPKSREMIPAGSGAFDAQWFAAMAARPEVGFVLPRTRQIAAVMDMRVPESGQGGTLELLPSAVGDPLLPAGVSPPRGTGEVVLSASAMRRLGVREGAVLEGAVTRTQAQHRERATVNLTVVGRLAEAVTSRDLALVSLDLLVATEDYRDGRAVKALDWPGQAVPEAPRHFAGFRLYARTIHDVAPLREVLTAQGLEVRTKSDQIAFVESLDRNLGVIFRVIAALGVGGYAASLGANLWLNIDMKRRDLSLMRTFGVPTAGIVLFPVVLAMIIAAAGSVISIMMYGAAALGLNTLFSNVFMQGELCRLLPEHFMTSAGLTLLLAVLVSIVGGLRASFIQPSENLRDV